MNRARSALLCYRIVSAGLSPVCLRVVSCSLHDGLAECWLKPQDSDLLDKLIQLWSWWKTSICISNILKSAVPLYPFRGAQAAGPLAVGDAPQQAPAPQRPAPRFTGAHAQTPLSLPRCRFVLVLPACPSSPSPSSDFIHRRGEVYLTLFV